jgi:DNA-binding CsgD family transcriptional regulator
VADRLGISVNTLGTHLRHIYEKFGLTDDAELSKKRQLAVQLAKEFGILLRPGAPRS